MVAQEDFEELQTYVAAMAYYLYRLAGCPYGHTLAGYDAWISTALSEPFNRFCEPEGGEDEPLDEVP